MLIAFPRNKVLYSKSLIWTVCFIVKTIILNKQAFFVSNLNLLFKTVICNIFHHYGTHKLITIILQHTKNVLFTDLTKIRYNFDSFISDSYFVLAAVIFFLFDNLREKRSVPLTIQSGIGCFKNSCGTPFENPWAIPFGSGVQQAIPSRFV